MTRLERAFAILLLLGDRELVSATELARRFEVSVRTIYRDVEMLSATGVPIYAERGHTGGYRLHEGFYMPPVAFTRAEAAAALLALALARGLRVPPFAADLETAERKLVAALPPRHRPLLAEMTRLVGFERAPADIFHPEPADPVTEDREQALALEGRAVELFMQAVLDGTRVRLAYRSSWRLNEPPSEVDAEPRGLLWDRDRWYLIGDRIRPGGEGGPRSNRSPRRFWRADRVAAIEPSSFRSGPGEAFDVRRALGRRWIGDAMSEWRQSSPVRIRVTPTQAQRLKPDWLYGAALFEPESSGTLVMTYGENSSANTYELVRWLGPGAELLEPAEWRAELAAELSAMAAGHGPPSDRL